MGLPPQQQLIPELADPIERQFIGTVYQWNITLPTMVSPE